MRKTWRNMDSKELLHMQCDLRSVIPKQVYLFRCAKLAMWNHNCFEAWIVADETEMETRCCRLSFRGSIWIIRAWRGKLCWFLPVKTKYWGAVSWEVLHELWPEAMTVNLLSVHRDNSNLFFQLVDAPRDNILEASFFQNIRKSFCSSSRSTVDDNFLYLRRVCWNRTIFYTAVDTSLRIEAHAALYSYRSFKLSRLLCFLFTSHVDYEPLLLQLVLRGEVFITVFK